MESANVPPPEVSLLQDSPEEAELNHIVKWIITLLSVFQTRFFLTNRALNWLLRFLGVLLGYLGRYSPKITELSTRLPRGMHQYNKSLSNIVQGGTFERRAVCSACASIYNFEECIRKVGSRTYINRCTYKPFKKACNEKLMKEVMSSSGHRKFYPHAIFCFASLITSLQALVLRTGFMEQCESTRKAFSTTGLSDVYDGTLWKDFLTVDQSAFLSGQNNYGLLLNVDWLQPYEHVQYSLGVMYLVILNLPRAIRFKRENVILFGVIPGPREPSLTMNTYLSPLVSDLLQLWSGVELKQPGTDVTAMFRCALLGVACDLPAARKVCGFLSFSANLGCSRCFERFSHGFGRNCYDNFNRESWGMRDNDRHRSDVERVLQCTTKTQREKKEAELGCRFSSLLDLPYFRPIEMLLIDPVHNLLLGTAKHFAHDIWIGRNILDTSQISNIETRLRNLTVPVGLGRIPVSINVGCFLTADQWKNWTIYFSVYCLKDLLPPPQLECWRHFVLACRRICQFSVTEEDITIADGLLLRFCKCSVQVYGSGAIRPNMHMHCHMASCIREFGPAHSFWLFPFERYNGILEGQPTNNRSIELQLMHRFQRDNMHLHLHHEAKLWPNADHFLDALPETPYDISTQMSFDVSVLPGPNSVVGSLSPECLSYLCKLYSILYPAYATQFSCGKIAIPSTFRKYSSITWHGKKLTSTLCKSAKNPFVFVVPPFPFEGQIVSAFQRKERLAEIDFFLVHSVLFPNTQEPEKHLLACTKWPKFHPNFSYFGKPVEVWCTKTYEQLYVNRFVLASSIATRVIIGVEKLSGERVRIAIPLVE